MLLWRITCKDVRQNRHSMLFGRQSLTMTKCLIPVPIDSRTNYGMTELEQATLGIVDPIVDCRLAGSRNEAVNTDRLAAGYGYQRISLWKIFMNDRVCTLTMLSGLSSVLPYEVIPRTISSRVRFQVLGKVA